MLDPTRDTHMHARVREPTRATNPCTQVTPEVVRELDHAQGARGTQAGAAPATGPGVRASGAAAMMAWSHVVGGKGGGGGENVSNLPPVVIMEDD